MTTNITSTTTPIMLLRAVRTDDLDGLLKLARQAGTGMTTLKPNRAQLAARIEHACASFAQTCAPDRRDYLFVLEDLNSGALAGVSALRNVVGYDAPFYNFRHDANTLTLATDLAGSAELCSLYLAPEYRHGSNGKLLSKARLLFIAQFSELLAPRLIAELRGVQRDDGSSPFWDSLGQKLFGMNFEHADNLSALGDKTFIGERMPREPLPIAGLTLEAQAVIGAVHCDTAPAQRLLEQEGMRYANYVDIFDAGPVLEAPVLELRAVRESRLLSADELRGDATLALLVAKPELADFRVIALAPHTALSDTQRTALAIAPHGLLRVLSVNN